MGATASPEFSVWFCAREHWQRRPRANPVRSGTRLLPESRDCNNRAYVRWPRFGHNRSHPRATYAYIPYFQTIGFWTSTASESPRLFPNKEARKTSAVNCLLTAPLVRGTRLRAVVLWTRSYLPAEGSALVAVFTSTCRWLAGSTPGG